MKISQLHPDANVRYQCEHFWSLTDTFWDLGDYQDLKKNNTVPK